MTKGVMQEFLYYSKYRPTRNIEVMLYKIGRLPQVRDDGATEDWKQIQQ